ncbi:TolC family protein [Fulvivirgaceae bacterium BMA10]|uniref:TolC family protein n=1 Tax=Splendidivirga corallicola TaxID=3051826 RepID=A0ABT8KZ30_9BACT|nr:TolC family protein [Fulvivirgaceae bacterium BMA10]
MRPEKRYHKQKAFFSIIAIVLSLSLQAQDVKKLTLDECIDIAMGNNIALQRAQNSSLIAAANKKQALLNFLPTLQTRINYDFFTGTFFDTNAARQVSETTNSSGPRLSSNLNIFNGFRNHQNRKQRNNEFEASKHDIESSKLVVESNVILYYMNVAVDRENIKIARNRVDLLSKQLEREEKREQAGVGRLEEVYNLKSQVANEKLNLVNLENQYKMDKLLLIQALQLNTIQDIEIADLTISEEVINSEIQSYDNVIRSATTFSPNLKSATYSLAASKNALNVARAARYPSITFTGVLGSNYSSNGARNPETGDFDADASFFDQIDFNQFEYFDFTLNIPIFTRGETNRAIQVAKINMINSELDLKQATMDLTNSVQQAYLDLLAAKSTYDAALENLIALEQTFKFMETRYTSGDADLFSYLESLDNKNRAELELANSKYRIALRKKILEVYQGL